MRWFLDCEFHEDGRIIDLISIALVAEDGRAYYAVSNEFEPRKCNEWVRQNVLPKLPPRESSLWRSRKQIASDILTLALQDKGLEIWGYFADYDWVVLCQLYGAMVDLPKAFGQQWCFDLKQHMITFGITKAQLPPKTNEHDSLADARWIRAAFLEVERLRSHGLIGW